MNYAAASKAIREERRAIWEGLGKPDCSWVSQNIPEYRGMWMASIFGIGPWSTFWWEPPPQDEGFALWTENPWPI